MTEREWLACTEPERMLEFLRGKVSDRKLRLFACAWCRRAWDLLGPAGCRKAVTASEAYADGLASLAQLQEAHGTAQRLEPARPIRASPWTKAVVQNFARMAVAHVASVNRQEVIQASEYSWVITRKRQDVEALNQQEMASKAVIFRDIFGNPYKPVTVNQSWLTSTVVSLAQAIYDDRAFDRMPVLADALEDAGCTSSEMLGHCRGGGEHVRGCWLVDLLLQKE